MSNSGSGTSSRTRAAFDRFKALGRCLGNCVAGMPDYDTYVAHFRQTHPDQEPMSYEAFFRDRQDARYGAGPTRGFRCC